jgi:hypothetical protein
VISCSSLRWRFEGGCVGTPASIGMCSSSPIYGKFATGGVSSAMGARSWWSSMQVQVLEGRRPGRTWAAKAGLKPNALMGQVCGVSACHELWRDVSRWRRRRVMCGRQRGNAEHVQACDGGGNRNRHVSPAGPQAPQRSALSCHTVFHPRPHPDYCHAALLVRHHLCSIY